MATDVTDADGALVLEHLDGVPGAFDALYRRYFPRLVRFGLRTTRSRSTAEDVAQETLIRAHAALERFDPDRPLWPWLKTIASRLLIDHARARSRELLVEDAAEETAHTPGHADLSAERSMLLQALSALPERQRDAVVLRYLEDWDGTRVAEHLGLNGLAFRQILHRARRRLQAEYRRLSETALGAILVPLAWAKRTAGRASARLQRAMQQPNEAIAIGAALNLAVAAIILGGGLDPGAGSRPGTGRVPDRTAGLAASADADSPPSVDRDRGPSGGVPGSAAGDLTEASGTDGGDPVSETGRGVKETVDDVVDPNRDVHQPEDASIFSMSHSPRFDEDRTVFAIGLANCPVPPCQTVLFRTTDAGASWARLPAVGFEGTQLALPPAYPDDHRIFAMGPGGMQVSHDGGASFADAAGGTALGVGALAVSPTFNAGDARILIGSQSLMEYRDDTRVVGPAEPVPGRGPLYPAFSPEFARDGLVFVGGLQPDAGGWRPTVFRCHDDVCSGLSLPAEGITTEIRIAPDFAVTPTVYAFTENHLLASRDAGETFGLLPPGWDGALDDLALAPGGRVFAVGGAREGTLSSLYRSDDGGTTWTRLQGAALDPGVARVSVAGQHVVAALVPGGVACSTDAGMTWATRCPAP